MDLPHSIQITKPSLGDIFLLFYISLAINLEDISTGMKHLPSCLWNFEVRSPESIK